MKSRIASRPSVETYWHSGRNCTGWFLADRTADRNYDHWDHGGCVLSRMLRYLRPLENNAAIQT